MMMWNCRNKHLLPLVAAAAAALLAPYAISDQSPAAGFINIDCGKEKGYNYTDTDRNLVYTSDFEYIDTGEIHKIHNSSVGSAPNKQALDLRSFPNGTRNCYTIKSGVEKGGKYLVRASFMYGNYDGKGTTPKFDLYLGVNFWTSIASKEVSANYMEEMITVPTSVEVSVCLINTGFGTPFISALELRPLPSELYDRYLTSEDTFKDLKLYNRRNFQGNYKRYPQDPYDRSWFSNRDQNFKTLTSTSPLESNNTYDPPSDVMKTAIYSSSPYLRFSRTPSGFDLRQKSFFLVILHFAEIQELKVNETRIFSVTVGDYTVKDHFSPSYLVTTSLFRLVPSTIRNFSLRATKQSTLPPIINAAEIFAVRNKIEKETSDDDVDAATAIKVKYKVKKNWVGDPCSPSNFTWDGLKCIDKGFANFRIVSINLSSSGLTGEISTSFADLSELQYLDLSRNMLTGDVPDILENLTHLKVLNLSGNKLSGDIPKTLLDRSDAGKLTLDYDQPGDNKKKLPTIAEIFIVIVSSAMIILFLLFCFKKRIEKKNLFFFRRKRRRSGNDPKCESIPPNPSPPMPPFQQGSKQLTSGELEKITYNFREEIGRGGFGPVYYGELDNAKVAVKILSNTSTQGLREFQAEASLLTTIHHRNLVSLLGYCNEENSLSLIYEYMEKGNLRDHLKGEAGSTLNWEKRLQISVEAAQGLEYLHVGCKPAIVHRDVKTGNILLNNKLQAKFSDFGLSKLFQDDFYTHISTRPAGTIGYMDPEYFTTGMLNEKVDVYSFGVVLLELVTGLPALLKNPENINLSYWVRTRVREGKLDEIIDRRIYGECDINSVRKVVETALVCTSPEPLQRPTMTQVLMLLKECLEMVAADAKNEYSSQE